MSKRRYDPAREPIASSVKNLRLKMGYSRKTFATMIGFRGRNRSIRLAEIETCKRNVPEHITKRLLEISSHGEYEGLPIPDLKIKTAKHLAHKAEYARSASQNGIEPALKIGLINLGK